ELVANKLTSFRILLGEQILMMLFIQVCDAKSYSGDHANPGSERRQAESHTAIQDCSTVDLICDNAESEHRSGRLIVPAIAADLALDAEPLRKGFGYRQGSLTAGVMSIVAGVSGKQVDRVEIDSCFLFGLAE